MGRPRRDGHCATQVPALRVSCRLVGVPYLSSAPDEQVDRFTVSLAISGVAGGGLGSLYGTLDLTICVVPYTPFGFQEPSRWPGSTPYADVSVGNSISTNTASLLSTTGQATGVRLMSVYTRGTQIRPSWVSFQGNNTVLIAPSASQRGLYLLDFTFTSSSLTETVVVQIRVPNSAPTYSGPSTLSVRIGR
jgi:hypothetical protein